MKAEDWKILMAVLSLRAKMVEFSYGTDLETQHAITDHMIGVAEVIEAYPVPPYVKALGEALERANLQVSEYRKFLWVMVRKDPGLLVHLSKEELNAIPEDAELLSWFEPLFDSFVLSALLQHVDSGPRVKVERVIEKAGDK